MKLSEVKQEKGGAGMLIHFSEDKKPDTVLNVAVVGDRLTISAADGVLIRLPGQPQASRQIDIDLVRPS